MSAVPARGRILPSLLWACALALSAGGCTVARFYNGAPLRSDAAGIVEGASTKSDVLRLFGPPTFIEHQTDGDAFVYRYAQENFSSITIQEPFSGQRLFTYRRQFDNRDTLVVLLDFVGVVRGVSIDHRVEDMPLL